MADTHHDDGHHGPTFQTYMAIAGALCVCTASSFIVNWLVYGKAMGPFTGFLIILSVAMLKAFLVGVYFMHLKWDWNLLYFIIVPAFILGTMMMIVLLPDCYFGPVREADASLAADEAYVNRIESMP